MVRSDRHRARVRLCGRPNPGRRRGERQHTAGNIGHGGCCRGCNHSRGLGQGLACASRCRGEHSPRRRRASRGCVPTCCPRPIRPRGVRRAFSWRRERHARMPRRRCGPADAHDGNCPDKARRLRRGHALRTSSPRGARSCRRSRLVCGRAAACGACPRVWLRDAVPNGAAGRRHPQGDLAAASRLDSGCSACSRGPEGRGQRARAAGQQPSRAPRVPSRPVRLRRGAAARGSHRRDGGGGSGFVGCRHGGTARPCCQGAPGWRCRCGRSSAAGGGGGARGGCPAHQGCQGCGSSHHR